MNLKCIFRMSGECEAGLCEEAEDKCIGFLGFFLEEMCFQGQERRPVFQTLEGVVWVKEMHSKSGCNVRATCWPERA